MCHIEIDKIIALLEKEVRPAMGCTEPAAVALACAYAARVCEGKIQTIEVVVDPNVYKNGMGVYVPGADTTGLCVAAALGAVIAQPELELQVLGAVTPALKSAALRLVAEGRVHVRPEGEFGQLKILARVNTGEHEGNATISGSHTNLSALYQDGKEIYSKPVSERALPEIDWLREVTVRDLMAAVSGHGASLDFLVDLAEQNYMVALTGIKDNLGVGLGHAIKQLMEDGLVGRDLANCAMLHTAGASDARMSGLSATVIATNGSGNQGITASVPLYIAAGERAVRRDRLAESLALSHLMTIYVKLHIGKLSASCACAMAAAIGAGCGLAYMFDYGSEAIENTVGMLAANLTGMICDGAKVSCSFKLATAACTAVQTALFAGKGISAPIGDGVLAASPEATIRNLGRVSTYGMRETDRVILDLMCEKNEAR
ncbi:MAG TPA: L-serine ammonia-lyase, iron-sulfur-dependent, subunit alpha [Bacillota bacterium]|nr:L-serine ammonia-lyase, iron-sulfur-dependent, subunit alpha [Bacillota bacterium]